MSTKLKYVSPSMQGSNWVNFQNLTIH